MIDYITAWRKARLKMGVGVAAPRRGDYLSINKELNRLNERAINRAAVYENDILNVSPEGIAVIVDLVGAGRLKTKIISDCGKYNMNVSGFVMPQNWGMEFASADDYFAGTCFQDDLLYPIVVDPTPLPCHGLFGLVTPKIVDPYQLDGDWIADVSLLGNSDIELERLVKIWRSLKDNYLHNGSGGIPIDWMRCSSFINDARLLPNYGSCSILSGRYYSREGQKAMHGMGTSVWVDDNYNLNTVEMSDGGEGVARLIEATLGRRVSREAVRASGLEGVNTYLSKREFAKVLDITDRQAGRYINEGVCTKRGLGGRLVRSGSVIIRPLFRDWSMWSFDYLEAYRQF